jgi:hypothetical protein
VFTSRVLGLICDSEACTAIVSDGQHIGTSQELQALNGLRELLGILYDTYLVVFASQMRRKDYGLSQHMRHRTNAIATHVTA